MMRYVAFRLLQSLPAFVGVTLVVFLLLNLSGDPTQLLLPPEASDADRTAFKHAYGLDQPVYVQYGLFVIRAVQGDFGRSFAYNEPAMSVVIARIPATLELSLAAILIAVLVAIPGGVLSAIKRYSIFDRLAMLGVLLGQSVPTFWLGMMLILLFAVNLQIFPVSGRGSFLQMVLPSVTLAAWLVALIARLTRSGMLDVLGQDYIRTARAKGLRERVITIRHALRNTLIPIVTVLGLQFSDLLGGAIMTETVFAWPGVGTLVMDSLLKRDYPVVLSAVVFVASGFVLINLLVDLLYGYLDPRIRYT